MTVTKFIGCLGSPSLWPWLPISYVSHEVKLRFPPYNGFGSEEPWDQSGPQAWGTYFYISMPVHSLVPHAANSIIILAEFIHIPSVDVDGGCQFWDQQHMLCCYHIFVYGNVEYSISLLMASSLIGQVAQMSISTIKHRQKWQRFPVSSTHVASRRFPSL